jgi:phage N-6-adenine-methyltransferase
MKDKLKIHTSSKSNEWETPKGFFKKYDDIFNFDIDVASTDENHLVDKYWTIKDDALSKDWSGMTCWMNPPYGREIGKFVKKAYEESLKGATVVCLIPSRTDTAWWHEYVLKGEIEFIRGRLKFVNRTFPS